MTNQPAQRPECDHHWIHYGQPATGLKWIIQCSQCGDFDAEDLQEQITAAEQRGADKSIQRAERLLKEDRAELGETVSVQLIIDWLRMLAGQPINYRADQMEGDDDHSAEG